jgi:hypothetical protein
MNSSDLKADLKAKVLDNGIAASFGKDWITSLNEIGHTYDHFLLTPPTAVDRSPRERSWRHYEIVIYLFRQNKASGGKRFTTDQRDTNWTELQAKIDEFLDLINADNQNMQIIGEIRHEEDENSLGNDALIWIKTSLLLRVNNC